MNAAIQEAGVNFIFLFILVIAVPAAIKLTALAVVLVNMITISAIIPNPNLEATVLGSELLGLKLPVKIDVPIVEMTPTNINHITPNKAP